MKAPEKDYEYYFKFSCVACAYFVLMHLVIHLMCSTNLNRTYQNMTDNKKKIEYRTYIVSPLHSLVCVILSSISMFYICPDGKTNFNNNECLETPRLIHVWALLHSCGYFIVDFIFFFFLVGGRSTLDI